MVVLDSDYEASMEKLRLMDFRATRPNRDPPAETLQRLPDPAKTLREVYAGYANLDRTTTTFTYPAHYNRGRVQMVLLPASYAHLSPSTSPGPAAAEPFTTLNSQYDHYENLHYPLERVLLESFIQVVLHEPDIKGINLWAETLKVWVGTIHGYLDVENDAVDDCADDAVRDWYSRNFGREREAKFGPMDRRISKRLGSGKEMPYDMRRRPI